MNQEAEVIDRVRYMIRTRYRSVNDHEEMESYILHRIMVQYAKRTEAHPDYMAYMIVHAKHAANQYMQDCHKRLTFVGPLIEGTDDKGLTSTMRMDNIPTTTVRGYTYPRWRLPVPVASKCNAMTDDLRLAIRNLVKQLNAEQQEVARLHWWENESIRDIAERCKITVAHVGGVIISIVEEMRELVLQYNDEVRRFGTSLSSMIIPGRIGDGEGLLLSLAIASSTITKSRGRIIQRRWSAAEDKYVRKHYGQTDIRLIADVLDRKYNGVVKRASVLRKQDITNITKE